MITQRLELVDLEKNFLGSQMILLHPWSLKVVYLTCVLKSYMSLQVHDLIHEGEDKPRAHLRRLHIHIAGEDFHLG